MSSDPVRLRLKRIEAVLELHSLRLEDQGITVSATD